MDEDRFRIAVFQQILGTLLLNGFVQHHGSSLSGVFSLVIQQLEEHLRKEISLIRNSLERLLRINIGIFKDEYDFNIKPGSPPLLRREISQRFGMAKNIYREKVLEGKTHEEALAAFPNGMDPGHWEVIFANDYSPQTMAKKP
ncbi:23S rRNA (adenine(1618)-N(6))-methyltransferase [Ranunculus cassubicifolius]